MTPSRLAAPAVTAVVAPAGRWPFAAGPATLWLLGLGLLWLVPAWRDDRALGLLALWNLSILAAAIADFAGLPSPAQLTLERRWPGALTLGEPAEVQITLRSASVPHLAWLTDFVPPALCDDAPALELAADGRGSLAGRYVVRPRERGDALAGGAALRWQSRWRLVERRGLARLDQTVRVYPDRHEGARESRFLIRSQPVPLEKRRVRRSGAGREFESLRDYRAGDEPRDICWTAAARRGHLVTKVYQPERTQSVWILVDAGRLSRARAGEHTTLDRTVTGALTMAQVALASGDKVGLVGYGRRIQQRVAPARGGAQLRRIMEALADLRVESVEAHHAGAAAELLRVQKRRALVVWLTEIAETAGVPDVIEQTAGMIPRHVVLFAVPVHAEVMASAAAVPDSVGAMYRGMAAQEALERRHALLQGVRQRGALVLEASPQDLGRGLVDRYLDVKARGLL